MYKKRVSWTVGDRCHNQYMSDMAHDVVKKCVLYSLFIDIIRQTILNVKQKRPVMYSPTLNEVCWLKKVRFTSQPRNNLPDCSRNNMSYNIRTQCLVYHYLTHFLLFSISNIFHLFFLYYFAFNKTFYCIIIQ